MRQVSIRLEPGQDLRDEIEKLVEKENIKAGVLLSIVGGLGHARLRMAGSSPENHIMKEWKGLFEIVSGTGTVSKSKCHIHVSLSDKKGVMIGGHLRSGCIVHITAEIVLLVFDDIEYERTFDKNTGFNELKIKHKKE